MIPAWQAGSSPQRVEDRTNLADAGNGGSEGVWNLALDEHLEPQRDHAQHPSEVEAYDLERHEGLIKPSLAFNDVGEAGDVPGPAAGHQSRADSRPPQTDDRLHGLHVLWADLDAEVAADAVPDPVVF